MNEWHFLLEGFWGFGVKERVEKYQNNCKFLREAFNFSDEDVKEFWLFKDVTRDWKEDYFK